MRYERRADFHLALASRAVAAELILHSRKDARTQDDDVSSELTRVQFEGKDPRGFDEFKRMLAGHSGPGSAGTQLGV